MNVYHSLDLEQVAQPFRDQRDGGKVEPTDAASMASTNNGATWEAKEIGQMVETTKTSFG